MKKLWIFVLGAAASSTLLTGAVVATIFWAIVSVIINGGHPWPYDKFWMLGGIPAGFDIPSRTSGKNHEFADPDMFHGIEIRASLIHRKIIIHFLSSCERWSQIPQDAIDDRLTDHIKFFFLITTIQKSVYGAICRQCYSFSS